MQKDEQLPTLHFGAYKITGATGQILRRSRPLALSPKAVAVLWALAQRAGQVVSKEELFAAVWPETIVSEGVLTNCIHELRQALGETTAKPRYLETVPRRGYRFIAPVAASATPVQGSTFKVQSSLPPTTSNTGREEQVSSQPGTWNWEPGTRLVGREAELAQLHSLFAKAANGERQVVFVTGEAGIGKTALVDTFVQSLVPCLINSLAAQAASNS